MATRPKSKCKAMGCFELTHNGYCYKHLQRDRVIDDKIYNTFKRPERHQTYSTKEWKNLRKDIMSTNPVCQCGEPATICHHIISIEDAPELILDKKNIKPICQKCHNKIHNANKSKYKKNEQ